MTKAKAMIDSALRFHYACTLSMHNTFVCLGNRVIAKLLGNWRLIFQAHVVANNIGNDVAITAGSRLFD